jgi:hypothetical protein
MKANRDLHRSGGLKPCLPRLASRFSPNKMSSKRCAGQGAVQGAAVAQ